MKNLTEIVKGAGKGLLGATIGICQPSDDRLYETIKTQEGRFAYRATIAGVGIAALTSLAILMAYIHSQNQ
jgi:hypothetical protein